MRKLFAIGLAALGVVTACNNNNKPSGGNAPSGSSSTTSATGNTSATIKIGNTSAYSGPASAYGVISKVAGAYTKMINDKGGVGGKKIEWVSYDDGYSANKTVEQTRKLVEQDNVLAVFHGIGTAPQSAVRQYLNDKKVPQLFVASGADKWSDPKYPWTVGFQPSYQYESRIFAKWIKANKPNAKMCVIAQNDDFGKDYQAGLKTEFAGDHDKIVGKVATYEVTDPTIDSQIVTLQGSGCDTILIAASPKFAAQALRKIYDIGWKPTELLSSVSSSITSVLKVAGLEKTNGVIVGAYLKDATDPKLKDDPAIVDYRAFMAKYVPDADAEDWNAMYGYAGGMLLQRTLEQCGEDFSRENIMKTALHLKDVKIPVLLDGIKVETTPENPRPMKQMQLAKFNGKSYDLFGTVLSGE